MAKRAATLALGAISLDQTSEVPLYRQLYDKLREAILTRQLTGGTRLPSTRLLANELSISRNTVMSAFEQLLAEGYLEGKVGAGTYVAQVLPEDMIYVEMGQKMLRQPLPQKGRTLSKRSQVVTATRLTTARNLAQPVAFRPGMPDVAEFPGEVWSRLVAKHWQNSSAGLLGYGEAQGYKPLREAIAAYLWTMRGVHCEAEQIVIVAGSQQGLDLAARVLLDPGEAVWLEDPGYLGARSALLGAGAQIVPVPVDAEGLNVEAGVALKPEVRLAYISPSHQYPLGVTMSLARRLALLEWANHVGAWILEDDYDSEYRYASRPLAALQGLDNEGRVIYLGTFSKVLFPALRLGYLVVPPDLIEAFVAARAVSDRHSPSIEQAVLADFITEGHFARHIRRMRALYAERQQILVKTARQELRGLLEINPAEAGMHLVGWLPTEIEDCLVAKQATVVGMEVPALSAYALEPYPRGGLLLGYAGFNELEISQGIHKLKTVLGGVLESL